jgi:hypothetical protein
MLGTFANMHTGEVTVVQTGWSDKVMKEIRAYGLFEI